MRKEEEQGTRALRAMGHVLLGGAIALVACVVFLIFASIGVSGGWLKEGLMGQITVASCVVGALIGGLTAVGRHRAKGLMVGVAVGACLFLLLLTVGYLCYESVGIENGGVAILVGCLCGGALAGLLGGSRSPKGKKSPKRKRSRSVR